MSVYYQIGETMPSGGGLDVLHLPYLSYVDGLFTLYHVKVERVRLLEHRERDCLDGEVQTVDPLFLHLGKEQNLHVLYLFVWSTAYYYRDCAISVFYSTFNILF